MATRSTFDAALSPHGSLDSVESGFVCPGSTTPISRALHLARVSAAWEGCDHCAWRAQTEGISKKSLVMTDGIRRTRSDGLQRTEFGIRGEYLNVLDRRTIGDLMHVFCCSIPEPAVVSPGIGGTIIRPALVGFDSRTSSLDLYVAVVSAIRDFGLPVISPGLSTAASLHEALRRHPECSMAVMVTGSGCPASWSGLDVVDSAGESQSVIWEQFGIQLRIGSDHAAPLPARPMSTLLRAHPLPDTDISLRIDSALRSQVRHSTSDERTPDEPRQREPRVPLNLILPDASVRASWKRRIGRTSGLEQPLDFESTYRDWLLSWYPQRTVMPVAVQSHDPLIRQRVQWLAEHTGLHAVVSSPALVGAATGAAVTLVLDEDDRQFEIRDRRGMRIDIQRLASAINDALSGTRSAVSAHADLAARRFWLLEPRRAAGVPSWQTRDGLALLGLLLQLAESGRLPWLFGSRTP